MKGGYTFLLARPLTEVDDTLRRLAVVLAFVTGAGVAIAVALGTVVTRTAVAPVARLTETAERVTATGDLSHRIEISDAPRADELARLATSFNAMLEALEGSVLAQRRLVADASHELRTPLTSLRTNVELLASGRELAPGERERLLADATGQLEELSTIVADLVELARGGEPVLVEQDVRLDDLVRDAIERAERDAPTARFSIETPNEPVVVRGDPSLLGRAVANLLDNAVKWSRQVEVTVEPGAVAVRDHGPGFDPADLPHVFDRFYRSTAARGTPGSGLGLAIVKQVAEAHGGHAVAENAPGGGATVRLELGAERAWRASQE
jgi:two-component system sensor histidine kinase MprB